MQFTNKEFRWQASALLAMQEAAEVSPHGLAWVERARTRAHEPTVGAALGGAL